MRRHARFGAGLPARRQQCGLRGRSPGYPRRHVIIWTDGTRSHSATPHPSVIIGNKSSVRVGPGVFVGTGKGSMPLDDPTAPNKTRGGIVDGVSYC
ncbi:hypothetical protein [Bradyrhizobium sp. LHD-71]|uniref:hypothetical protein n=1 Tax=Bradyrhizobium sp. LHD-71 TaxID=3072141 RepID=UPI0035BE2175